MLLYLIVTLVFVSVLVAVSLSLKRSVPHPRRLSETLDLDAEKDLLQSNVVFGNISGEVETPDSSEVFNEMVTFQSSVGDDHSLLLRKTRQRSLLSRLKLSALKSKRAETSQHSKEPLEQSGAEVSALGESTASVTTEETQIPAPVPLRQKADVSRGGRQPPEQTAPEDSLPADTSASLTMDRTQIPAPGALGQSPPLDRSGGKAPTPPEGRVQPAPAPSLPERSKGRQPVPRPRRQVEGVGPQIEKESLGVHHGPSEQEDKPEVRLGAGTEGSPEEEEQGDRKPRGLLPMRDQLKLKKPSMVRRRPRGKPSAKPSAKPSPSEADVWLDTTLQDTLKATEMGSEVESEAEDVLEVTELHIPTSRQLTEETQRKPQQSKPSKPKEEKTSDGKPTTKDPIRKLKTGKKERKTQGDKEEGTGGAEGKRKVKDSARKAKSGGKEEAAKP